MPGMRWLGEKAACLRRRSVRGVRKQEACSALNLREVVIDVLIEDEFANLLKRELAMGPNLGQVENVVAELLGLLGGHSLLSKMIRSWLHID